MRNRVISIIVSAALMTNSLPLSGLPTLSGLLNVAEPVVAAAYEPSRTQFSGNSFTFDKLSDFVDYCYLYQTVEGFDDEHEDDNIIFSAPNSTLSNDFLGLGTPAHPFAGSLTFPDSTSYTISIYSPLFQYLADSATVGSHSGGTGFTLILNRLSNVGDGESNPLFAEHVVNNGGNGTWSVTAGGSCTFSGVIGEIGDNAHVNLTYANSANTAVVFNAATSEEDTAALVDAGAICGKMGASSGLTLSYTGSISHAVTSANGNAGGLVGSMGSGASLTISSSASPTAYAPTVTGKGYAGGLVGDMASDATITNRPSSIGGSVKGDAAAGGLYGRYAYTTATTLTLTDADFQTTATVSGGFCGGLYGELATNGGLTITSGNTAVSYSTMSTGGGCFGGVIGKLTTATLTDTVKLQNLKVNPTANATFSVYGGVIGKIASASYVEVDTVEVNAGGSDKTSSFGGVIGETADTNGVFVNLSDFTLTGNGFKGGGVVGNFHNGVLRLSGTTDMSAGKPADAENCGQLVGQNDNVLVYALGTGSDANWTFKRSNGAIADDLGTWGEVVRISNIETDLLTYDTSAHTVTLKGAVTTLQTPLDFTKTALNIQLNQGSGYDCLLFTAGDANTRGTLLGSTLNLGADISLTGTGITGFMRDGGTVDKDNNIDTIGKFTGTLNGLKGTDDTYKITLATGEVYGLDSNGNAVTASTEGAGQIYRHKYTGLFAVIGGDTAGTVSNLTVDGSIVVRNRVDGMNIGGIASRNGGNVTLTKVITNETIKYHEGTSVTGTETTGKNIGGLIGFVGENGTITIGGECVVGKGDSEDPDLILTGSHTSWNVYGGAIGKITASVFTIDVGTVVEADNEESSGSEGGSEGEGESEEETVINKLTMKMVVDISGITGVGSNSDCGGLIGHITKAGSYEDREVNINNLEFTGCKIGNAANTNGGGLLGYSWLNATAKIEGMTVTSATISNCTANGTAGGNVNVGAMCYEATGKWVVDKLTVTSLTVSGGVGSSGSIGMLVNKAYTDQTVSNVHSYTGGLYLDVLNSGYTLSTVSLPTTGKYDEIAAYTARDVDDILTGGAGVISINMNDDRNGTKVTVGETTSTVNYVKITDTGTYSNQVSGKTSVVNQTSRYYYNLDAMSKANGGQNLLLWSVKNYAYSDLSSESDFDTTLTTTLSGTADMTGLSFYPVALADGITIGTLNLTFDYEGIEAITGTTMDPGATVVTVGETTTDNRNQHYLMHSGLFLNSSAGSTLTISGELTLSGNFLEVGDYKGVLISDTMQGSLNCTSGSISLSGITPKTTGKASYTNGYLLINNIYRENEQAVIPELQLYNVSSTGYTAGTAVAKSLIGAAVGPGLKMDFSKVKLDGDSAHKIFSDASLVYSIRTDQNAQLKYNFTWDDDWGTNADRNVTYGKELSDSSHSGSVEYPNKETKYSSGTGDEKHRWFVNPDNGNQLSAAVDFSSYLPYVHQPYTNNTPGEDGFYYRELKVNVEADGLTVGCGTYNDPYIISSPDELTAVAKFLKNGVPADLGKVNLPMAVPEIINTGDRWCDDKSDHAEYTYDSSDAVKKFTSSADDTGEWEISEVQEYLASAYYQIENSITLDATFDGLGGSTASTAFRGVIVGKNSSVVITNNSTNNPFINISNGCVIKDITIEVGADITREQEYVLNDSKYYTYGYDNTSDLNGAVGRYYGGIIGEIMGGDNIIDNSYVRFSTHTVTLSGTYGTTVPVGGYVGVIVYGGLIFKNMTASKTALNTTHLTVYYGENTDNNLAANTDAAKAAIYVNPLVGRVINGYAVNETEDVYETAEQAALNGHAKPQIVTSGKFTISEDGTYHDDHTVRLNLPKNAAAEAALRAKVKAFQDHEEGAEEPSAEEMEQYNNLSKLHTLKNGTKHYSIADINKSESNMLNVSSVPANTTTDGSIDVPNAQALFILSLITQSTAGTATDSALGTYANSLSYGTYDGTVYGMSHNAEYSDVGTDTTLVLDDSETENVDESSVPDYSKLACYDTANNADQSAPIPYIIKHYTVGSTDVRNVTEIEVKVDITYNLDGQSFVIRDTRSGNSKYYLVGEETKNVHERDTVLNSTTAIADATEIHIEKCASGENYYLWFGSVDNKTYLKITNKNGDRGNLELSTSPYEFTIEKYNDGYEFGSTDQTIKKYINFANKGNKYHFEAYKDQKDAGNKLKLFVKTTGVEWTGDVTTENRTEIPHTSVQPVHNYPARCVTSTLGYYDISLKANVEYALPDSFRGLGCVGLYDSESNPISNKFSMKVDTFDGKGCTIDADIYLNKFQTDNYFNVLHAGSAQKLSGDTQSFMGTGGGGIRTNHGIGLFDSIIAKTSTSSVSDFVLTGSVNTEIYSNSYSAEIKKIEEVSTATGGTSLWLSVGGVCGWMTHGTVCEFSEISLNNLIVSGADFVGGLLGFSGLNSETDFFIIKQCDANNISVKMSSAKYIDTDRSKARNGIGCFVGKVLEGGVYIYGTSSLAANTDLSDYSTVTIESFGFANSSTAYDVCAGGLVGFAGNGCKVYDMRVKPTVGQTITIGSAGTRYAGGLVGLMQPANSGKDTCKAIFHNCVVEEINVNGHFAGGFYGGKWINEYSPYSIELDNCKMIGNTSNNNTITGNALASNGYAGGFLGCGNVYTNGSPNILIKDSTVSNYTITSESSGGSVGGFMGYSGSQAGNTTITCYIHDSAVEHCVIGASGNYAGGAIGRVVPRQTAGITDDTVANKMLGYNIKLDNVTTGSGDNMGAWIGYLGNGKTSIQFTGVAIYGTGYSKNVGTTQSPNAKLSDVSFVFADYTGQSYGNTTTPRMSVSGDDVFTLDASNKTILRTVSQDVTVNGKTENRMQIYKYRYSEEPEGDDTESADGWSLSNSQITHVTGSKTYVYDVTLTDNEIYSLNASDKIITRQIISGSSTHTIQYNYTTLPTGIATTDANQWSIDETNGTLTRIVGGQKYVYTIAVSGLNKGTVVTMPKYPFVNVNPQSKLGASEIISSDGAVLYGQNVDSTYIEDETEKNRFKDNNGNYYPSSRTMAAKIYADILAGTDSRRYTTFDNANSAITLGDDTTVPFISYMQRTTEDEGDRISTFATERQIDLPSNVDDFAVLVIATADDDETTDLINRYIQLVTNTTTDYAGGSDEGYFNVDIQTCKYDDGSFSIVPKTGEDGRAPGLTNNNNQFQLDNTHANSVDGTFTLLDVQFMDPFHTDKIAYHLYVPVYTVKEMAINFYAVAKTGAHSVAYPGTNGYAALMEEYKDTNEETAFSHVDSFDTWMTHYIRYEYQADDIMTLLNTGNVKWNYQKTFNFKTRSNSGDQDRLPDNTLMVLVDPNGNADQAYYAKPVENNQNIMTSYQITENGYTKNCWTIALDSFKTDDTNPTPFKTPTFNDVIASSITETPSNSGKYRWLENITDQQIEDGDYDVYAGSGNTIKYYEFCPDNDGNYNLTVTQSVCEDYYLSIYVPKGTHTVELYHYWVKTPTRFSSAAIDYDTNTAPNVKSAGVTQKNECTILVANLFKQTVTDRMIVTPANEQITANNRTITVDISSVIEPNNLNSIVYLNADDFYHSFYINLVRYSENGVESDIQALSETDITAKYNIDSEVNASSYDCADLDLDSNYLNVQTFSHEQAARLVGYLKNGNANYPIEGSNNNEKKFIIYSKIEMVFDEEKLNEEFPERGSGETHGVNVQAASNLAYDVETLSYTSMTEKYDTDRHYYYIETVPSATLRYASKTDDSDLYDEIGLNSKNQSTLGVNGRSANEAGRTNMPVNTEAFYNVQSLSRAGEASKLYLTFALSKKTDNGDPITGVSYSSIADMRQYLEGTITFKSGTAEVTVDLDTADAAVGSVTVALDTDKCSVTSNIYDIVISFNAKSGTGFALAEYANYKIDLGAVLYKSENNAESIIDNSDAQDYLIYTNAKINPEYLTVPEVATP